MMTTASDLTAGGATARITYHAPRLQFAADGTYTIAVDHIPATLSRAVDGTIIATLDWSPRNDHIYRVLPTDTFNRI